MAEGTSTEQEFANRPENTKFKQQRLDAWQPILTPTWVIGTFFLVGAVFVPVGAYLWKLSDDLYEQVIVYDSYESSEIASGISSECGISSINEGFDELHIGSRSYTACELTFTLDEGVEDDAEVFLYYQIENFYQNHRRYVKSVSEDQLQGDVTINPLNSDKGTEYSTLETACDPVQSFKSNETDRIFYPCGLIAQSTFNDGIQLRSFTRGNQTDMYAAGQLIDPSSTTFNVSLTTEDTAWSSDLDNKYVNPVGGTTGPSDRCTLTPSNPGPNGCVSRYTQLEFLWQTYDQFECYKKLSGSDVPDLDNKGTSCMTWNEVITDYGREKFTNETWDAFVGDQKPFAGTGCAACASSDEVLVPAGGLLPPGGNPTSAFELTDGMGSYGVRDDRFIVWMRTAGLPTFRKLYGKLNVDGGFKTGDKVTFTIIPNFLVKTLDGSKALVLGTTSPLGGKNDILGTAYMTVGSICLVLAVLFALKLRFHPRKLGDPKHLQVQTWKDGQAE